MVATVAETVEVYELLKPKLGDQEAKFLLRFIEDRTVHLVRDEIANEVARLEKQLLAFQWQTRLYFLAIGALIILTNPRVLDFLGRLLGLAPGP